VDAWDFGIEDQLACVDLAFQLHDEGRAQIIRGNHEMSYLYPHMICSGHNVAMKAHFDSGLREKFLKKATSHIWFDEHKLLIVHGGLTNFHWIAEKLHVKTLDKHLKEMAQSDSSWIHRIGMCRGGNPDSVGGIYWCDWGVEFEPVPAIRQIVGHTRTPWPPTLFDEKVINQLRTNENGDWCIDCLDRTFQFVCFDDETGEITPMTETIRGKHV